MMKKAPAFFKFFIAERNIIDVEIPIAFIRHMKALKQELPKKVCFRDRHNYIWTIKVAKVGQFWYFVDGWDKFVRDNMLTSGHVVLFEYVSNCLFHIKVFGPTATEKYALMPSMQKVEEPRQEQISEHDNGYVDGEEEDTESDPTYVFSRQDNNNDVNDEEDENHDDEETKDADFMMMKHDGGHQEIFGQRQVEDDGAVVNRSTHERLIQLYPKCYGLELFEAGLAKQPKNPYFVTKIMPKRKSDLFIPSDVIKDYTLDLGNEITLVDPNGREFRAKCKKWKDGRSILSKGWRRLCRVNFVALEDICICEFVKRGSGYQLTLHISFVRAAAIENQAQNKEAKKER